jgi:thiosulfate dehydrogenase (quinone) large subunit
MVVSMQVVLDHDRIFGALSDPTPFLDEHVVYAVLLFALVLLGAASYLGLGDRWNRTRLVRRLPFLK